MANPKVSIIIPLYNGENFIEGCLDSVFAQTYTDFEVLVVNDGSTDGSLAAIERWKAKNQYLNRLQVFSTSNFGVSSARNTGIAQSSGDFIAFLDCDDYWEKGKLNAQVKVLEEDSACIGSITNFFVVRDLASGAQKKLRLINHRSVESLRFGWLSLLGNGGLISSSLIYRKNLETVFSRDLSTSADLDFFLKLGSMGRLQLVETPLVNYRIHGSQMHLSSAKLVRDYLLLSKQLRNYGVPIMERVLMGNAFAMSALLEYSDGNFTQGFSFMKKSMRTNFGSLFQILASVVWKRIRGKSNLLLWRAENAFGKNQ
jgi:glycosyltransferase involved in cell wall biosynthesis